MSERVQIRVLGDPHASEMLHATRLVEHLYRLEESAILNESMDYGDVVEAELNAEGQLQALRVVAKANYLRHESRLSRHVFDSDAFRAFGDALMDAGGMWEYIWNGFLVLHVPPGSGFDVKAEWRRYLGGDSG